MSNNKQGMKVGGNLINAQLLEHLTEIVGVSMSELPLSVVYDKPCMSACLHGPYTTNCLPIDFNRHAPQM